MKKFEISSALIESIRKACDVCARVTESAGAILKKQGLLKSPATVN